MTEVQASVYTSPTLTVGRRLKPVSEGSQGTDNSDLNAAVAKQRTYLVHDRRVVQANPVDPLVFRVMLTLGVAGTFCRMRSRARLGDMDKAHANDTTTDPEAAALEGQPLEVAPYGAVPTKTWRVHACLHNDTKEAELGFA